MSSKILPLLSKVKRRYNIQFKEYIILIYHPVTGEKPNKIKSDLNCLFKIVKYAKKILLLSTLTMIQEVILL